MTSTAMAISKISGKAINPGELDSYLDKNGGYNSAPGGRGPRRVSGHP